MVEIDIKFTREFLLALRESWLNQVDAIERLLGISPRTSELRKLVKEHTPRFIPNDE